MEEFITKIQENMKFMLFVMWILWFASGIVAGISMDSTFDKIHKYKKIAIITSILLFIATIILQNVYLYLY